MPAGTMWWADPLERFTPIVTSSISRRRYLLLARLAAQYLRILSETAFLAAADIRRRRGARPSALIPLPAFRPADRTADTNVPPLPAITLIAALIAFSSLTVAFSASRNT